MYKKHISKIAINSMLKELNIVDKPGLVTPVSNGNHVDMDYFLMRRAIRSLKKYFSNAFELGFFNNNFEDLREMGKRYEVLMLRETNGINTHKGALFQLGILVYLIGRIKSKGVYITKKNFRENILNEINNLGLKKLKKESVYGARREVFEAYDLTFKSINYSLKNRLYYIMSEIYDTNIIKRGDISLLKEVQKLSKDILRNKNKFKLYELINKKNLSPGGAADILINSIFIEDFFKYEYYYTQNLKENILNTKEMIANFGYRNKVILSLVMPGFIKTDEKFIDYFNRYKKTYDSIFGDGIKIYNDTGYRVIYDINKDIDLIELKKYSVKLEKNSLIDIDIYGDILYDRNFLKIPQRKCIICNKKAKTCIINREHSLKEVIKKSLEIVNEN